MLRVGLTGGLASGKSFVGRELQRLGCAVLQADRLGHQVLSEDARAMEEVLGEFGKGVLTPRGTIDRNELGALAFSDEKRLAKLNSIVHPRVFERLERFFSEAAEREPDGIAVVEAAIMIESGSYRRYQRLVLAACPRELQIERFIAREGASRQEAEARIQRQLPLEEKRKYAHFVIDTAGTKESTLRQVRRAYRRLKAEAAASTERTTA